MGALAQWMAERMALPKAALGAVPQVTLTGAEQVLIENHQGILSYSEDAVEVGCGRLRLRVTGTALLLRAVSREALVISGNIGAVEVDGGK